MAMNKNWLVGETKLVKGPVKKPIGTAAGDTKLRSDGGADKAEDKTQTAIGDFNDLLKK